MTHIERAIEALHQPCIYFFLKELIDITAVRSFFSYSIQILLTGNPRGFAWLIDSRSMLKSSFFFVAFYFFSARAATNRVIKPLGTLINLIIVQGKLTIKSEMIMHTATATRGSVMIAIS